MSEEATLDKFVENDKSESSEWIARSLGELAEYQNGNAFSKSEWGNEGYPIIRIQNLTGEQDDFNYFNGDLEERYEVEAGDTLLSWSATIDVFQWSGPKAALNQHIFRVDTSNEVNDTFYRFKLEHLLPRLVALSHGSTMQHVRKADLVNVDADIPPLPEQRKIATVLHTVDRAIEKTDEIIEQVKRTKQALTQSLFLDGYFDHSEIVDAHHQNRLPHHPAEWQTKPAGEVIEVTRGAHPRPKSDDTLWRGEIPIIKIGDRNRGDSRTITSTDDTVTEKGSQKSKLVDEGTLIVSNAGTVGTARITGMQTCIHDHWLILRDYDESLSTRYLYYFINWNQEFLEALASGSTVLDLNTDDFRLFDVTFPGLEEQQKIADTLDILHNQKMSNVEYSNRLKRLKHGLMQDLLSGTIRTTDTNIEVLDEVAQYG